MTTKQPMIPVPNSLGGDLMRTYRNIKPAGQCSDPQCKATAVGRCKQKLKGGGTCNQPICEHHTGKGDVAGLCPPHARLAEKTRLYP